MARLDSSLRQALQATIACALAMVVGGWVSKERWLWAVLTAFVVFTGAATRSETLVRAWHRTFGTLVGVAAGLAVARLTAGHHDLQLALSFASIFGAFYALRSSYAVAVFFFTAQLALVYGVLGLFTPELLYLRIEETLVGVAVGTLVVAFVLPAHGRDKVRRTAVAALQCMHDLLADPGPSCRGALATSQLRRLRDLDRQVRNVRVQARPLVEGPWSRLTPDLVVATHALFALAFYVRRIARQTESRNDVDTSHLVRRLAGLTRGRQTLGVKPSRPDRPRPAAWLPPDQDDPRRSAGRMEQLLDDLERSL